MRRTKISHEFEFGGQRSKVKVTRDKEKKKCGIVFGSGPRGAPVVSSVSSTPVGKSAHAVGSRPSDHYFRSVCWFVCLFVCAGFFSAVFDPISIKLGICYMSGSSCVP